MKFSLYLALFLLVFLLGRRGVQVLIEMEEEKERRRWRGPRDWQEVGA